MDNYKAYSLQEVETWLRESLEADCTPQEIHDSIVNTVKNNMKYHRACYRDSVRLLSLLRGNKNEFEVHETFGGTIQVESLDGISTEFNNEYFGDYQSSFDNDITIDGDK